MIGRRLSHFRILSRLGEGGMGVVYRAQDEKLQRTVALKVLPPERLGNEESRLRIVREARVAAAISHPNIAVVHEIDEEDGVVFVAMELIEGRTLTATIGGVPLPLDEALRLAAEIADGLAAAHQARVIHRDLKPENIIVTPDRRVKILDFGLAKVLEARGGPPAVGPSRLTTISDEMTDAGRVMGTTSYMSPEQVRGQSVDVRSDLFAFGIVLYEMVTGKRPFRGATSMDVMTAILREEPAPPSTLNPEVPPELDRIVAKCLEKDATDRYQDTRDLVVDLRRLKKDTTSGAERRTLASTGGTAAGRTRSRTLRLAVAIGAVALVVAGAWISLRRLGPAPGGSPQSTVATKLTQRQLLSGDEVELYGASLSPDGKYLAYAGDGSLFVREIATSTTRSLPLQPGAFARAPAWAPDGAHVYVRSTGPKGMSLWVVSVLTGEVQWIRDGVEGGPSPSPNGDLVAFVTEVNGAAELWVASPRGEAARKVVSFEPNTSVYVTWSPSGRSLAVIRRGPSETAIEVFDLDGKRLSVVVSNPLLRYSAGGTSWICWLHDGRLLYSLSEPPPSGSDMNIWSVQVDPATGRSVGTPARITSNSGSAIGPLDVSPDGRRLLAGRWVYQVDTFVGDLSPDGSRLDNIRRVTFSSANDFVTDWTGDGRLLLLSDRNGPSNLFVQALDSREPIGLVVGPEPVWFAQTSPDGLGILYFKPPATAGASAGVRAFSLNLTDRSSRALGTLPAGALIECRSRVAPSCVIQRVVDGEARYAQYDFAGGEGREFARFPNPQGSDPVSALSRDGSRLLVAIGGSSDKGAIRVIDVPGGRIRTVPFKDIATIGQCSFTADGRALIVSTSDAGESALLRVEFDGRSVVLRRSTGHEWMQGVVPSPDRRHLAFAALRGKLDLWLLENF